MRKFTVCLCALLSGLFFSTTVPAEFIVVTEPVDNYNSESSYQAEQYAQENSPQYTSESPAAYSPEGSSPVSEDNIGNYSGMMSSLYRFINGNAPVSEFSIRAEDLSSEQKAFVLYYYQYNCEDSRIHYQDGLNCAYILDVQDMMNELFYNATAEDMQYFEEHYVEERTGELYYMMGSGDFGDAGNYHFNNAHVVESDADHVTISGDVLEYDNASYNYLYSDTYTASFKIKTVNGKTCCCFDSLTVGSGENNAGSSDTNNSGSNNAGSSDTNSSSSDNTGYTDTYGSSGYDGSAIDYSGGDTETKAYLSGLALDYFERHYNHRPEYADVEDQQDGTFLIHLYDFIDDAEGGHTATSAWYLVDYTGYGSDQLLGNEITLLE